MNSLHILHQKRNYPVDFNQLSKDAIIPSVGNIMPVTSRIDGLCFSLCRKSDSGGLCKCANYLVKSDADWNNILDMASKPGVVFDSEGNSVTLSNDGIDKEPLF